jgi:hypothetical protein
MGGFLQISDLPSAVMSGFKFSSMGTLRSSRAGLARVGAEWTPSAIASPGKFKPKLMSSSTGQVG